MKESLEFLQFFDHKVYTLCHLGKKGMRSFPCKPEKLPEALEFLHKKNREGDEIYFMVNEGSGEWNEKKTACHGTKQVKKLTALFLDAELTDNKDPLPAIKEFCEKHFFEYHFCIETSPNRFHIYWLLNSESLNKQNIIRWKQLQAFLHSKLSSDRTMTDIPQILRIPGFVNNKKVTVVQTKEHWDSLANLELDKVYEFVENNFPEIKEFKAHEPLKTLTEDYVVPEGERHEELIRRARKLYNVEGLNDEDIRCFLDGFILNHFKNSKEFLNGSRKTEVDRILTSAKSYAIAETKETNLKTVTKALEKKQKSPFELDEDFFYQAPGLVGDITRYFVDNADYPIPAHSFAAACSLVGLTKCRYIHGENKLPPLNYFMCLAPAGSGKTTIQHLLRNILEKLAIIHLVEDGISSAQGLIQFLSNHNSMGLVIYDEVKDLFQNLKSKNSFELKIATEITKLYTGYGSRYIPPTTKTQKNKTVLNRPLFSLLGFGHFTLVETLLTKATILEGLVPRFIILRIHERKKRATITKPVPESILSDLRYHCTKSALVIEEESAKKEIPVQPVINYKKLTLDSDAELVLNQFDNLTQSLYTHAVDSQNGLEALFSRGTEQVQRMALAMSESSINAVTMQFCTDLLASQLQNFHQSFDKVINRTESAKETDALLDTITELCATSSDYTISKRDLQRKVASRYKNIKDFHTHLESLSEMERVTISQIKLPSGKIQARVSLLDVT